MTPAAELSAANLLPADLLRLYAAGLLDRLQTDLRLPLTLPDRTRRPGGAIELAGRPADGVGGMTAGADPVLDPKDLPLLVPEPGRSAAMPDETDATKPLDLSWDGKRAFIPFIPLFASQSLRALLVSALGREQDSDRVDERRLIDILAAQKPLRNIPRLRRLALAQALYVFVQRGDALDPYRADISQVYEALERLFGPDRVRMRPWPPDDHDEPEDIRFDRCGTVLIIASFAASPGRMLLHASEGASDNAAWERLMDCADRASLSPILLTPAGEIHPPAFLRRARVIPWGPETTDRTVRKALRKTLFDATVELTPRLADPGANEIDSERLILPDAACLAELASLAEFVEPALLRQLRLSARSPPPPSAEAQFWFGPYVRTRSSQGVAIDRRRAEMLLISPVNPPETLSVARRLIEQFHARDHPVQISLESLIWVAADLSPKSDAERKAKAQAILGPILAHLRVESEGQSAAAARWINIELPRRLPATLKALGLLGSLIGGDEMQDESDLLVVRRTNRMLTLNASPAEGCYAIPVSPSGISRIGIEIDGLTTWQRLPDDRPLNVPVRGNRVLVVTEGGRRFVLPLDPQAERDDQPAHPELFISYASGDLDRAAALHARLVAEGHTVWFDRARLTPDCDWHKEIEAGCEAARIVLPLITRRWAKSEWTRYETYIHEAVIPVRAEGKPQDVMPPPLRRWNAVALDPLAADEPAWQALLAAIRTRLAEPVPERTPRIVDLPYPPNPFFTGREDDLVRIHEELHAAPVTAPTQGRVHALAAMGGMGKTTLANEYARRFWRLYPQILWVDARAGLESGFALLFGKLFPGRPDAGMQQADKAALVLAELSGRAERLLVLDNVEDAESVRPWLVRDPTSGCRTLITSRYADWSGAAAIRGSHLNVPEPEAARQFLLTRTGRTAEGAELTACDDLARELGYLPLALEQAAAYIAAPGAGVDFAGYLRLYREATAELLARGALGSTEYPDPVITTWQATVAKLSPESRAVLRLCAWYADRPIPRALVMQGVEDVLALAASFGPVAPLSGPAVAGLRMRDALTGLGRYSMILDAQNTETFRVHGLVQAVERARAEADDAAAEARDRALTRLTDLFPYAYSDPSHWPLCRLLLPHQQALLTHAFPDSASDRVAQLLNLAGGFLEGSGDAAGAFPLFRRALDVCERVLGKEHPLTLASLNNLARCMAALGDAVGALPLYRRALDGRERVLGKEHPDTLISVNNLATCVEALGDVKGALPLYRRALDSSERVLGWEHPETLTSVNNLAECTRALGDAAEALPLYRRALDSCERVLGKDHPNTLTSVNNLALCMQALGDAAGALPLYRRALDIRERVLGKEHPDTLSSVNNLAFCMETLGDAAGALPLFRRALDSSERVLGKEHPNTLASVNNLAWCMAALGDAAAALPLYRRAADGFERLLGPDHPSSRTVRTNRDQLEREVAAAQHGPKRQPDASRTESQQNAVPWWQRLVR